jgi:DHA1 family inner membrane transport protein
MTHSALNLGNSMGAFLGGAAIAATQNYHSQLIVGSVLGLLGLILALLSFSFDSHTKNTGHTRP